MSLLWFVTRILAQPRSRLRAVFRRKRLEEEMETELRCHLDFLTRELMSTGLSATEARRRASIALGPSLMHKEQMRASLGLRWRDECMADLRYGSRMLRKTDGCSASRIDADGAIDVALLAEPLIFRRGQVDSAVEGGTLCSG
jgi:hypothetical protein